MENRWKHLKCVFSYAPSQAAYIEVRLFCELFLYPPGGAYARRAKTIGVSWCQLVEGVCDIYCGYTALYSPKDTVVFSPSCNKTKVQSVIYEQFYIRKQVNYLKTQRSIKFKLEKKTYSGNAQIQEKYKYKVFALSSLPPLRRTGHCFRR